MFEFAEVLQRFLTFNLFADDSLIFCRANDRDDNALKDVLKAYCQASGQLVNDNKSEAIVSNNVEACLKEE